MGGQYGHSHKLSGKDKLETWKEVGLGRVNGGEEITVLDTERVATRAKTAFRYSSYSVQTTVIKTVTNYGK